MEFRQKKIWTIVSSAGTIVSFLCFCISIFQYFTEKQYSSFAPLKYDSLIINTTAFLCFVYLIFNPLNYKVYAFLFYVYGTGNFLDNGNVIGLLCFTLTAIFLNMTGFFKSCKYLKISVLAVPALTALAIQFVKQGFLYFIVSVFHIIGAVFMGLLIIILYYPRLKQLQTTYSIKELNSADCTQMDLEWLTAVLDGKKYIQIARESNVSESKVKARMLELYKILEVHDKTEFMTVYNNYVFTLDSSK